MRAAFLSLLLLVGFSAPAMASSDSAMNHYDVFRNGKQIGTHVLTFTKDGSKLTVETQSKMKVKMLFITAFSYDYKSTETWQDGVLINVDSVTENRSGGIVTSARRDGDVYRVVKTKKSSTEESVIAAPLRPTSHWNKIGLDHNFSFDPITGINFPVTTKESSSAAQENFLGQRYDVNGEYEYATYYDAAGHWQGMTFTRKGDIEFRCVDCQNTLWPDTVPDAIKARLLSYP